MPPYTIDPTELWAAIARLANENDQSWRFTKKGDRKPAYDVEAQKASRRKTIKAKQEAATTRTLAAAKKRNLRRAGPDGSIAERMLKVMEPGQWYGQGDLMRMVGEQRTSRAKLHQVMVRRGWVEKARNPAWSGLRLSPQQIQAGAEPEPEHLYRLTELGLTVQAGLPIR